MTRFRCTASLLALIGGLLLGGVANAHAPKIGILMSSYGDIDGPEELRELVVNTLSDPDVLPLPVVLRQVIAQGGYEITKDALLEEYAAIGNRTNTRYNTRRQADLVAAKLRWLGYDAKGYAGFTMTYPYVREALNEAQSDGIDRLVVFYQGAQYSQVTSFVTFRHVEEYLNNHPEWDVDVIGVKSFYDTQGFEQLLVNNLSRTWEEAFPGALARDVCIFLPVHGNVLTWIDKGDPYARQVMHNVGSIKSHFSGSYVAHGFQNHDETPFVQWTGPEWKMVMDEIVRQPCSKVLTSGQISIAVDVLGSAYDHGVLMPEYLFKKAREAGVHKEFALVPMVNTNSDFIELLRDLALEALDGRGDLVRLGVGELRALDLKP